VGRVQKRRLSQTTDREASRVGADHRGTQAVLMKPNECLARGVTTQFRIGHESGIGDIGERQTCLELNQASDAVNGHHERWRDDGLLRGRDPAEIVSGTPS
jgi:hypothetical protein